jgi:predicted Zn-dependent protease
MNSSPQRWLPLALILLVGVLAIVHMEHAHIATPASPQAILSAAADAQHELTRVPAHFDQMSDADEIRVGDALAMHYVDTQISPGNAGKDFESVEAYIQRVGEHTATHARRKLPWHFHYIPNKDFVNAFALPGGHIFVGEGLLRLMHSEDALAAVLGHEIEHVDLRHCAERIQAEQHMKNFGGLLNLPVEVFLAGYSKEQELEADRDGVTLAVEADYSPLGLRDLFIEFQNFERPTTSATSNPINEAAGLTLATLTGYFQSHPPAAIRLQQLDTLIATNHWASPVLTPLSLPRVIIRPTSPFNLPSG